MEELALDGEICFYNVMFSVEKLPQMVNMSKDQNVLVYQLL